MPPSSFFSFVLGVPLLALALTPACSSNDDPPPRNGVNDVKRACEIRASWTNKGNDRCINCQVAAQSPACDCEAFKDFASLCKGQDDARRAEPTCTAELDACTKACTQTDCACIDGCYAQSAKCKQVSAAKDGCIADVCTQYCQ
ncbi:MAG: hypothetical protein JWP87_3257 [Labilithrix sp.]|nr:hypothetical protein [Labilithrix sp.]